MPKRRTLKLELKHLGAKLLAIRKHLGLSQSQLAARLTSFDVRVGRISTYERGYRVPNVLVLLDYARLGQVSLESIVDDGMDLSYHTSARIPHDIAS